MEVLSSPFGRIDDMSFFEKPCHFIPSDRCHRSMAVTLPAGWIEIEMRAAQNQRQLSSV
jgi:hypothetical protein